MEEIELLQKIKADPSVFALLFRRYYHPIFAYVYRRIGHIEDSSDVAANTFYKAFLHINRFTPRGISIKVWLYRIATNETNLYFRHRRRRSVVFSAMDITEAGQCIQAFAEDSLALEAEMQKHQRFQEVREALKMIPLKYQEVVALRYFEGKSNREIGEILDTKEGTVKSLLSRGIGRLRQKLQPIHAVGIIV